MLKKYKNADVARKVCGKLQAKHHQKWIFFLN